jgi:hypothetical protein
MLLAMGQEADGLYRSERTLSLSGNGAGSAAVRQMTLILSLSKDAG